MKNKGNQSFWLGYSDLMTSLFFIMLVLFIVVFSIMNYQNKVISVQLNEYKKIEEIKKAINNIDKAYFQYSERYKKYILNIEVHFKNGSNNILDIPKRTRNQIVEAGNVIYDLIKRLPKDESINYLVIIEGQASNDNWEGNDELSYKRALSLKKFWIHNNIQINELSNCELVISGSGQGGVPRKQPDVPPNNQRFLIHIIPKVGQIVH